MSAPSSFIPVKVVDRLPFLDQEAAQKRAERDRDCLVYICQCRESRKSVKATCKDLGISRNLYYNILRRNGIVIAPSKDVNVPSSDSTGFNEALIQLNQAVHDNLHLINEPPRTSHIIERYLDNKRAQKTEQPTAKRQSSPRGDSRGASDREHVPEASTGRN